MVENNIGKQGTLLKLYYPVRVLILEPNARINIFWKYVMRMKFFIVDLELVCICFCISF